MKMGAVVLRAMDDRQYKDKIWRKEVVDCGQESHVGSQGVPSARRYSARIWASVSVVV